MDRTTARRLSPRWRRWLLTLHIGGSVALLGADGAVLALTVLTPTLATAADAALGGVDLPAADRLAALRNSAAASAVLLVTLVLSVHKPFGRLRGRSSARAREQHPGQRDGRRGEGTALGLLP
jgi:hypothetical protein